MRRYSVVLAQNVALQQNSAPEGRTSLLKLKVREHYQPPG